MVLSWMDGGRGVIRTVGLLVALFATSASAHSPPPPVLVAVTDIMARVCPELYPGLRESLPDAYTKWNGRYGDRLSRIRASNDYKEALEALEKQRARFHQNPADWPETKEENCAELPSALADLDWWEEQLEDRSSSGDTDDNQLP